MQGDLRNVNQKDDKSLLSYIDMFIKVLDEIKGFSDDIVLTYFENKFKSNALAIKLQSKNPTSLREIFEIA